MSVLRNTVILDSNLIISAFLSPQGTASQALCIAVENFEIACSKETFGELLDVLKRDKFNRYATKKERAERLEAYAQNVVFADVSLDCYGLQRPERQ